MALVRGKFISADEAIKQNVDPSAPEDLARKLYVDNLVANIDLSSKVSKDGDTMIGGLRIETTNFLPNGQLLALRQQLNEETTGPLANIMEMSRIVAPGTTLNHNHTWITGQYVSNQSNLLGQSYLLDFNTNCLDSGDFEVLENQTIVGTINGYAGTIESLFSIGEITQGFWEHYSNFNANTISGGGLYGTQLTGYVQNMPGTQTVSGFDFFININNKELGEVSAFKHAASVTFTDEGTYKGLNLSPTVTGGAARTGVHIDMSASSGSVELKTRSIDARGNSFFQGNMFVDQVYLVSNPSQLEEFPTSGYGYLDYTEMGFYDDVVNRSCRVTLDFVSLYSPDSGRSTVGIGQIELVDSSNQPSIPAGDSYVTTKKYVDDQIGATLKVPHKENFVLTNTDISNGYVDLTRLAVDESTVINLGGIEQHEGDDYTVSTVGGVTRLTFIGPLLAAVVPGDKVYIRYWSLT